MSVQDLNKYYTYCDLHSFMLLTYAVVKSYMIFIDNYIRLVYIFGSKFEAKKCNPTERLFPQKRWILR